MNNSEGQTQGPVEYDPAIKLIQKSIDDNNKRIELGHEVIIQANRQMKVLQAKDRSLRNLLQNALNNKYDLR